MTYTRQESQKNDNVVFYIDSEGYYSLTVDNEKKEYYETTGGTHTLSRSGWHRKMVQDVLNIDHYKDTTGDKWMESSGHRNKAYTK